LIIEYNEIYKVIGEIMNMKQVHEEITGCEGVRYVIKEGDTLYKISRINKISLGELLDANKNINIYNLRIGDEICIPSQEQMDMNSNQQMYREEMKLEEIGKRLFVYVVKEGDSLESIANSYDLDEEDFIDANRQNKILLKPGSIVVIPMKEIED